MGLGLVDRKTNIKLLMYLHNMPTTHTTQSTHPFNNSSERRVVQLPGASVLEVAVDEATQMGEQVGGWMT